MNHNPTAEQIREIMRNFKMEKRLRKRELLVDHLRFGLGEIRAEIKDLHDFTPQDVHELVAIIKRRRYATEEDMYQLSHAFLQSEVNIYTFVNIPGAIPILIKELSGTYANRKQAAADCICNIANTLGAFICEKLCNSVGIYLVTYLNVIVVQLKRTCLWTLQNLVASSPKATQTLIGMELMPKLWSLYTADDTEPLQPAYDFRKDAGLCLQLMSLHSTKVLRMKDKIFLRQNLCTKQPNTEGKVYYLQIIYYWEVAFLHNELDEQQVMHLIKFILHNLCLSPDFECLEHRLCIIYALRVLSNLVIFYPASVALIQNEAPAQWGRSLSEIFNTLFSYRNNILTSEILWVLNNLFGQEEDKSNRNEFIRAVVDSTELNQNQH